MPKTNELEIASAFCERVLRRAKNYYLDVAVDRALLRAMNDELEKLKARKSKND